MKFQSPPDRGISSDHGGCGLVWAVECRFNPLQIGASLPTGGVPRVRPLPTVVTFYTPSTRASSSVNADRHKPALMGRIRSFNPLQIGASLPTRDLRAVGAGRAALMFQSPPDRGISSDPPAADVLVQRLRHVSIPSRSG